MDGSRGEDNLMASSDRKYSGLVSSHKLIDATSENSTALVIWYDLPEPM